MKHLDIISNVVDEYRSLKKNTYWRIKKSKIRDFKNRKHIEADSLYKISQKWSGTWKQNNVKYTGIQSRFVLYLKGASDQNSVELSIEEFREFFTEVKGNNLNLLFGK